LDNAPHQYLSCLPDNCDPGLSACFRAYAAPAAAAAMLQQSYAGSILTFWSLPNSCPNITSESIQSWKPYGVV
jgi:hypothetical protein